MRACPAWVWVAAVAALGCAGGPPAGEGPSLASQHASAGAQNAERLEALWLERTAVAAAQDFPIGPGDVIEVSVAGLPELEKQTARVSGSGTISLPLLGTFAVGGLSEREVGEEVRRRVDGSLMYDPSVTVFLVESRHRNAGVIGEVNNPGFYTVASDRDTVLDLISLAGGMTPNAAPRAYLHPAAADGRASVASPEARRGDAILIDLSGRAGTREAQYMNLPVRPGDVIQVAERGAVLVKGWVQKPGSYPITPGMSLLGAVTAAGGPRYAADQSQVYLIRQLDGGTVARERFDLLRLQSGEAQDIEVEAGDVVDVTESPPKVVASSIVEFLGRVLNIGTRAY